jgi:hypothetical protein
MNLHVDERLRAAQTLTLAKSLTNFGESVIDLSLYARTRNWRRIRVDKVPNGAIMPPLFSNIDSMLLVELCLS